VRGDSGDLLDMLLEARDTETGEGMGDRQVRDEIITLLIAGHETVASALTWTWLLLSQNPDAEKRLYAAVTAAGPGLPSDPVLPAANGAPPVPLSGPPFTQQVFDEALRLYPPAWIITRRAVGEDCIGGYPLKAGTLVIISPYTLHRNPEFWEDPEVFNPDRFAPELVESRPRFSYLPFGGGPRLCIGDSFARMEAQLILTTVLKRFRLSLAAGQQVEVEPLVTLRPKHGMWMQVTRR
jgi:cytochrome P450